MIAFPNRIILGNPYVDEETGDLMLEVGDWVEHDNYPGDWEIIKIRDDGNIDPLNEIVLENKDDYLFQLHPVNVSPLDLMDFLNYGMDLEVILTWDDYEEKYLEEAATVLVPGSDIWFDAYKKQKPKNYQPMRKGDLIKVEGWPGIWQIGFIQGPYKQVDPNDDHTPIDYEASDTSYKDEINYFERESYKFCVEPLEVDPVEWVKALRADGETVEIPKTEEELEDVWSYMNAGCGSVILAAWGEVVTLLPMGQPMLRIGDKVLWRQSLPFRYLVQPYASLYDDDFMLSFTPWGNSYWQAIGPIRVGIVKEFADADINAKYSEENIRSNEVAFPWTMIRDPESDILVRMERDESLPEYSPDFGLSTNDIRMIEGWSGGTFSDEEWYAAAQRAWDWKKGTRRLKGLREPYEDGYLRDYPETTASQFVWPYTDDRKPPDRGSRALPPPKPSVDPDLGTEVGIKIGEITPLEDILVPEEEEVIAPPIDELIVPDEEVIVPPEDVSVPVPEDEEEVFEDDFVPLSERKKRKKKKKKLLEDEVIA